MGQPAPSIVHSHWYNLIGNFQYSTKEYYAQVEEAIGPHQIPDITISRIEYRQGGIFSAKRQYLRIKRDRLVFDICGASFGNGFFFSWWLGELRGANIFVVVTVVILFLLAGSFGIFLVGQAVAANYSGMLSRLVMLLLVPVLLWLLTLFIRANPMGIEDTIMEIPYLGPIYQHLFRPVTYYKIDTALMFQSAVHTVVLEVVDQITKAQGARVLTADERKPIMREFYDR